MSNKSKSRTATSDSVKYKKDCPDFVCLEDGTMVRDCKYCNLSKLCQQVDIVDGKPVPMESHKLALVDPVTLEILEEEYYCTGMHDKRSRAERIEGDEKVS